jgi:hypothetical protein
MAAGVYLYMHINYNIRITDEAMKEAQCGINSTNHASDVYLFKDKSGNMATLESSVLAVAVEELANARKISVEEYIRAVKSQMEECKDVAKINI